jgi:hypothetical protein
MLLLQLKLQRMERLWVEHKLHNYKPNGKRYTVLAKVDECFITSNWSIDMNSLLNAKQKKMNGILEIVGVGNELVNASWRVGEDCIHGTMFMKVWWTSYECLITHAIEWVARPEFYNLQFNEFVFKLNIGRELCSILFVFPDSYAIAPGQHTKEIPALMDKWQYLHRDNYIQWPTRAIPWRLRTILLISRIHDPPNNEVL